MGDTGLELNSRAQVGSDSPVLLGFGALSSAQLRSNCYQDCYQARAVRGAGKDRSHVSCSSNSEVGLGALALSLSVRQHVSRADDEHWSPRTLQFIPARASLSVPHLLRHARRPP